MSNFTLNIAENLNIEITDTVENFVELLDILENGQIEVITEETN